MGVVASFLPATDSASITGALSWASIPSILMDAPEFLFPTHPAAKI
jgi:hypothetical protein